MCILRVFCELALKVHLFPESSALHRNIRFIIFPQIYTAITLKTLDACTCFYPQIVCRAIRILVGYTCLIALGSQINGAF
jgi:hypothetical protein